MSIRKKQEKAIDVLLARLDKAKKHVLPLQGATSEDANETESLSSKFDAFATELKEMRNVFPGIKSLEKTIMDRFSALEQELDNDIFKGPEKKSEVQGKLDSMTACITELGKSIPKVELEVEVSRPPSVAFMPVRDLSTVCPEWVKLGIENKILESDDMSSFFASFHCLSGSHLAQMCSLCLSVFPIGSVIEKKPLIYWWMGEGLVMKSPEETAEEAGERVFQELMDEGFIRPSKLNKSRSVNSFEINPWIHRMLILMAKGNFCEFTSEWTPCTGTRRAFLHKGNDCEEAADRVMMVFNLDKDNLRMKPEWLSKLRKVEVLQMGRWLDSFTHHIEVEDQTLFDSLGSQKHLKYLSLRGISRIEALPASISKLIKLQILDLRACHNLERLSPTISRLKNLTHLDVSHCYLLESMPKGLEQLVALQVLKGFVIGRADQKNSCKISDLEQLVNLKKLSIRVGEIQQDDQLESLHILSALRILTISWGNVSSAQGKPVSLPPELEKLDLRCVPFVSVPDWLSPSKLPPKLTKLYIRGGRLKSLKDKDGHVHVWNIRFLRFKYLDHKLLENFQCLDKFDCYVLRSDMTSTENAQVKDLNQLD